MNNSVVQRGLLNAGKEQLDCIKGHALAVDVNGGQVRGEDAGLGGVVKPGEEDVFWHENSTPPQSLYGAYTIVYVRQHWLLYVPFMMPAFLLTVIFKYIPMGGIAIAFLDYNPFQGIFGSTFVGF